MLQLKVCLQHHCFGGAISLQRNLKMVRDGYWFRDMAQSHYQDAFTKPVLERYKDKAKILCIEPKDKKVLGLFFSKESLIFHNCAKETSASRRQMQIGTFSLIVLKSKNMRRYFEASSVIKCKKDKAIKNVIGFDRKKCFSIDTF